MLQKKKEDEAIKIQEEIKREQEANKKMMIEEENQRDIERTKKRMKNLRLKNKR